MHGCQAAPTFFDIHTVDINLCPTVGSKDINPSGINSGLTFSSVSYRALLCLFFNQATAHVSVCSNDLPPVAMDSISQIWDSPVPSKIFLDLADFLNLSTNSKPLPLQMNHARPESGVKHHVFFFIDVALNQALIRFTVMNMDTDKFKRAQAFECTDVCHQREWNKKLD